MFIFQSTTFRRLDSASVFRQNLLSWAQTIELVLNSGERAQLSRFYLKMETESSPRNVVFLNKNRTVF
jgi:hypothetical protein